MSYRCIIDLCKRNSQKKLARSFPLLYVFRLEKVTMQINLRFIIYLCAKWDSFLLLLYTSDLNNLDFVIIFVWKSLWLETRLSEKYSMFVRSFSFCKPLKRVSHVTAALKFSLAKILIPQFALQFSLTSSFTADSFALSWSWSAKHINWNRLSYWLFLLKSAITIVICCIFKCTAILLSWFSCIYRTALSLLKTCSNFTGSPAALSLGLQLFRSSDVSESSLPLPPAPTQTSSTMCNCMCICIVYTKSAAALCRRLCGQRSSKRSQWNTYIRTYVRTYLYILIFQLVSRSQRAPQKHTHTHFHICMQQYKGGQNNIDNDKIEPMSLTLFNFRWL